MAKRRKSERAEVQFDGFSEVTEIGGGGFSTVYSAKEIETSRKVALKLLNVRDLSEYARETFRRETTALGILSTHPNIVTLYRTLQTHDGLPVLVMELCKGTVADDARRGLLAPSQAVGIAVKVAGALETAHRSEMLHQDVKPQNLLVTEYGQPALADFGVARLQSSSDAAAGVFGFTTLHAAPELLEGAPASAATDVYELASTLYQLLAGRAAFRTVDGEAPAAVILRILRDPVRPLNVVGVPTRLSDLLVWAMNKDPGDRPSTAMEFAELLQGIERQEGWPATSFDVVGSVTASPGPASPLAPDAKVQITPPVIPSPAVDRPVEHAVEVTSVHPVDRVGPTPNATPETAASVAPAPPTPSRQAPGRRRSLIAPRTANIRIRTCTCGVAVADDDRFCQSCGSEYLGPTSNSAGPSTEPVAGAPGEVPVPTPSPATPVSESTDGRPRICALGHPVPEDARFCERCGLPYPTPLPRPPADKTEVEAPSSDSSSPSPGVSGQDGQVLSPLTPDARPDEQSPPWDDHHGLIPTTSASKSTGADRSSDASEPSSVAQQGAHDVATAPGPVRSHDAPAPDTPAEPVVTNVTSNVGAASPAQPLINGPTVPQPIAVATRRVVTPTPAGQPRLSDHTSTGASGTGGAQSPGVRLVDDAPHPSTSSNPRFLDPEYAPAQPTDVAPAASASADGPLGGSAPPVGFGPGPGDRQVTPLGFGITSPSDALSVTDPLERTTLRPGLAAPSSAPEDGPDNANGLAKLFKPLRRRTPSDSD